jgi:hypothetical protein
MGGIVCMPGGWKAMRNLVLLLIAFLAVVTFIRAFDSAEAETLVDRSSQTTVTGSFPK